MTLLLMEPTETTLLLTLLTILMNLPTILTTLLTILMTLLPTERMGLLLSTYTYYTIYTLSLFSGPYTDKILEDISYPWLSLLEYAHTTWG